MKAMILAAGEGTRIREITDGDIPKPMVDLGPGPLLLHTVNHLVDYGVDEIVINLHHQASEIKEFFGDEWMETPIHYSYEEELRGTAGGVKKASARFDSLFLVVYGDILTDLDFGKLLDAHERKNSDLTVLTYREDRDALEQSSIAVTDQEGEIDKFIEKPSREQIEAYEGTDFWTNGAILMVEPEVLDLIDDGFSDFSNDVFPRIIEQENMKLCSFEKPEETYWHEVGNPERYRKAVKDVESGEIEFNSAQDY